MNYSRVKTRTGENNDPECLEYLSLTGTVFFLPLLWALTLTSLFIISQLKQATLVTSAVQDAFILISFYSFLRILFSLLTLSIETLDCSSFFPSTPVTDSPFFTIYSCLLRHVVSALRHQFSCPLSVFTEGLVRVVAQTQRPYFHHLPFARENRGQQAQTLREAPTLSPTIVLQPDTWRRFSVFAGSTSSPLIHSLNYWMLLPPLHCSRPCKDATGVTQSQKPLDGFQCTSFFTFLWNLTLLHIPFFVTLFPLWPSLAITFSPSGRTPSSCRTLRALSAVAAHIQ